MLEEIKKDHAVGKDYNSLKRESLEKIMLINFTPFAMVPSQRTLHIR